MYDVDGWHWMAARSDPLGQAIDMMGTVQDQDFPLLNFTRYDSRTTEDTWNIKFAGGRIDFFWDCFGNRVLMEEREVRGHLRRLAQAIDTLDVDVLLVQELDLNAKRSAHIDQLQWLLDHTSMNHGVYASAWRADYVPSDGLGPIDNGNAILSRWPMAGVSVLDLSFSRMERRLAMAAQFRFEGGVLDVLATHLFFCGVRSVVRSAVAVPFDNLRHVVGETTYVQVT